MGYYKWDQSTGGWARGDDGEQILYPYDDAGIAVIALLHIFTLLWIPVFFIVSFIQNGRIKLANWKSHLQAIIFIKKEN